MILQAGCILLGTYITWSLYSIFRNYAKASKIGLPVLINPIDAMNPLWFMTQEVFYPLLIKLPFDLGEFAIRLRANWTFLDRYRHHAKYGPAFVEATPASVRLFFADPVAMEDLSKRRNEFYKPPVIYTSLDVFGPNLDSVNGKVWERHRRVTVPPFNERNSALVWQATVDQASQLLTTWNSGSSVSSTQADVHAMALNVLCLAGFGVKVDFVEEHEKSVQHDEKLGEKHGYRASLRILLANFINLVLHNILLTAGYPPNWLWGSMKRLTQVKAEFQGYMQDLIQQETTHFEQGNVDRYNLLSSLVRANIEAEKGEIPVNSDEKVTTVKTSSKALTQDEIYGNLFIYNLAGHDTTAGTIHFALALLAVHIDIQEWLSEEINAVRASSQDPNFYYETTFPQLKRCLALMHETLRLYGPVQTLPRATPPDINAPLTIGDKIYIIPPDTQVIANFSALHTHPEHWGPDPLKFRPSRFIDHSTTISTSTSVPSSSPLDGESFREFPVAGTFVAWNRGQRICPGRKFSQVEFVAAMFVLFAGNSRLRIVPKSSETAQQAKVRIMKLIDEATVELTLKMKADIEVEWFEEISK